MNECSYSGWILASHSCRLGPAGPVKITSSDLSSSDMLYTIKARGSFKTWCPREPASPWQGGGWQQVCKGSGELMPFLFLSVAYSHCWWVKTQIRKHHMIPVLRVELAFGSLWHLWYCLPSSRAQPQPPLLRLTLPVPLLPPRRPWAQVKASLAQIAAPQVMNVILSLVCL